MYFGIRLTIVTHAIVTYAECSSSGMQKQLLYKKESVRACVRVCAAAAEILAFIPLVCYNTIQFFCYETRTGFLSSCEIPSSRVGEYENSCEF